ncbi:XkdF-like putative serine protease domain-containing protein [Anaerovibrio sp.]|uniref:XkdF-like putative serine protease domain-containing protein n=1 Tax=Anaerovibrio sp. TaxID=1872532 RepID=UPI003F181277
METFADAVGMSDSSTVKGRFKIAKSIEDKRIAFGWASIAKDEAGNDLVDLSDDIIEPDTLENAAYEFVKLYREGGEMHERGGCATLVESIVFTPEKMSAMGIPEGTLPTGWWIGFHVTDDEVWSKVKSGEYPMFSIEGEAVREPV